MLARLSGQLPPARTLARKINDASLSLVSRRKFRRLAEAISIARSSKADGIYLEAGVALGGTAVFIARLKPHASPLWLFDVFGLIPEPGTEDPAESHKRFNEIASGNAKGLNGTLYYGYRPDLITEVRKNLASFGITPENNSVFFIQGITSEFHPAVPTDPFRGFGLSLPAQRFYIKVSPFSSER